MQPIVSIFLLFLAAGLPAVAEDIITVSLQEIGARDAAQANPAQTVAPHSGSGAAIQSPAPVITPPIEFTVQTSHTAEIHGLEYAPNGKFFVSAGKDSSIKLWSPEGTLIRTIRTGFWVDYLAISHDSQLFLAASRVGTVFLLSLDGRVVHRFPDIPMREGFVSSVALSDDNSHAAIGTTKGLVLYRLEGTTDRRLPAEGDASEIGSVLFTRDGRLISGHADGKLRFWTGEGKLLRTVAAHDYSVRTLALSPDGKTVATAGTPFGDISPNVKAFTKLWDLDGNALGQFSSHFTQCLRFTADGTSLVSGGRFDDHVNIYRRSGELLRTITIGDEREDSPYLIALSTDGHTLITADESVESPGLEMWNVDGQFERSLHGVGGLTNVVLSPEGDSIVTVSADHLVRLWSLTGRLVASLPGHKEYSTGLAYAPNGMYFASGGAEVILWNRFGQKMGEVTGFKDGAGVLAFSPDSQFLFCGDGGGSVHIYNLKEKTVRHLKAHDSRVTALTIHPSGKLFATGSAREEVRIWDLDGKLQGESRFDGKSGRPVSAAFALAFSPDGENLVGTTTNPDKTLQIFDLKAQLVDVIKTPNVYQGGAVAFSRSGRWLAATVNNTVCVWDWPTRKLVHVLKGHSTFIEGLSFTPDEERLVTAGRDATTRVWRLDNGYSMTMLSRGSDWIVYTPEGYFDASHYGGDLVAMTRGLDTFGVDQFALQLNRPDLILSRMGIGSPEFIEHLRSRYQRRLERSGFREGTPGLSLEAPEVHLLEAKQDGKFA